MKKEDMKSSLNNMRSFVKNMPASINEAMEMPYTGSENMMPNEEEHDIEEPRHEEEPEMDVMSFVDDIRKKSLRAMAKLADNPDDERYQLLKKIWSLCDKKPEQQTAFSNPNQQNGMQPKNL